jgi:hypothetical protein
MGNTTQDLSTGSLSSDARLRNGLEEQQEILDRLSRELDDYFTHRGLSKTE